MFEHARMSVDKAGQPRHRETHVALMTAWRNWQEHSVLEETNHPGPVTRSR